MGRESLIRSTTATSLAWDDNSEKAVDRVTAIAMSARNNVLGSTMLRVEAMDEQSIKKAIILISRQLSHKHQITRGFANRMALAILRECTDTQCKSCGGRKHLHSDGEVVLICSDCGGLGLKRYTDTDRRQMVGSNYNRRAYENVLGYVRESIRGIVSCAEQKLDRTFARNVQ